ncbi:hypothetical protein [Rhizobium mesoamericanum]|uniref:Pectate lyase superfamily protein domain-containing protein n=1 Tax=Rhizobium mesoamericanum STM3625 TaxID=1211777 RepID=K0PZZ5_9HYPH|nr:hypothetical protein [Rhizobium mesoamericanum]CCM77132.1 hypothetical protein BN77_4182 [Rhizobium mesoamericanum STM3625]
MSDVTSYGALLDGVTDDSAAILAAIASDGRADIPYTPTGFVAGDIDLFAGQKIVGHGKPTWKIKAGASCGISLKCFSVDRKAKVSEITFDGSLGGATAIRAATANAVVFNPRLHDLAFKYCVEAIGDEPSASNWVVDMSVTDSTAYFTKGRQVYLRRTRGFLKWEDFRVDHTYNTWQTPWEGVRLEDVIGIDICRVDVLGPTQPTSTYQPASIGFYLKGINGSGKMSGYIHRLLVDNTRGPGIKIENFGNVKGEKLESYQNYGPGIELNGVFNFAFSEVKASGMVGTEAQQPNAPADVSGISLIGCSHGDISAPESLFNTGHGIVVKNSLFCKIRGGCSNSNTKNGYVEDGTSNRNLLADMDSLSNGLNSAVQIGSASTIRDIMPNGGTRTGKLTGAVTV